MKKKICLAIAGLLCAGCSVNIVVNKAKENGKVKNDYNTNGNVELSAYLGEEISYNEMSFKLAEIQDDSNWRLEVSSTNDSIKSFDVVEAYTCDLDGVVKREIISSPVTFSFESDKTAYYDLGFIFVNDLNRPLLTGEISSVSELRIIGENVNITYHMWDNYGLQSNGKNINDYDCADNYIIDANIDESLHFKVKDAEMTFEAFRLDKPYFKNKICLQGVLWKEYTVDIVDFFATDFNDGNKKSLLEKPVTMDFEKNHPAVAYWFNDVPEDYFNLCNGNVRYHIVTNYFTAIYQTYDYWINGKTIEDYDLSNLQEYENYCGLYDTRSEYTGPFGPFGDNLKDSAWYEATCDDKNNLVKFTFAHVDKAPVEAIDIIKVYFTDGDGNNVKEYLSTPVTLHKYIYAYIESGCIFKVKIDEDFEEYYALCKNNIYIFVVTNLGIIKMDLIDWSIKSSDQPGDFIDTPIEWYTERNNFEPIDTHSRRVKFENGHTVFIQQKGVFGLPYQYSFTYEDGGSVKDEFVLYDAYYTDENGNNKKQIFDKVYKNVVDSRNTYLFNCLAPEFSYFLDADYKVVLHLDTTWGTANFYLNDAFYYSYK